MTHARQNLELKARCRDLDKARRQVESLGIGLAALEHQTDTFFHAPQGRIKLREIQGKPAYLIYYERPDETGNRISQYHLAWTDHPVETKALLSAALGVRGIVSKRREIYLWHNVRIHLDELAGLGTFVEFEAVLKDQSEEAAARERLASLTEILGIGVEDRVGVAYADLLGL